MARSLIKIPPINNFEIEFYINKEDVLFESRHFPVHIQAEILTELHSVKYGKTE